MDRIAPEGALPLGNMRREISKNRFSVNVVFRNSLRGIDFVDRGCFPLRGMRRRYGGKIGVLGILGILRIVGIVGTRITRTAKQIGRSLA